MTKLFLALAVVASLAACSDFNNSPEQKAFRQFLEHCKAQPQAADCKAWEEQKKANN